MKLQLALTYDDITLVPDLSEITSRKTIDLTTRLSRNYSLRVPFVASPMDTICESEMAIAMARLGGVGIIHRFMSIEEQAKEVKNTVTNIPMFADGTKHGDMEWKVPFAAAVGANGDYLERAQTLTNAGANVILIDVAHGHHKNVAATIQELKNKLPTHVDIIAGNIATAAGAKYLESAGADAIRVGVGGGSLCSTRIQTGFGIPNVTSLNECVNAVNDIPIIACGGIKSSGDIAKAIAIGAESVILGSLLAGTEETPGNIELRAYGSVKKYRGAASLEIKQVTNQEQRNVEGESTWVPYKGPVKSVINQLSDGLRSAFSYDGASNIKEFHPEIVQVTAAGMVEARPHLI